jgi:HEPN domain-containing protein
VQFFPELAGLEADCRELTFYSRGSRYPDDLYEPSEADARRVVAAAHRVRSCIRGLIPDE